MTPVKSRKKGISESSSFYGLNTPPTLFNITDTLPPDGILLDTSFIVSATIFQAEYHTHSKAFVQKIIDNKTVVVYSALTELEFWNACLKLEVEKQERIPREKVSAFLKDHPERLKDYTKECAEYMELFIKNMTKMKAIKVDMADVIKDTKSMSRATIHELFTYDTIQLATMFYCNLDNIAALDRHIKEQGSGLNIYTIP